MILHGNGLWRDDFLDQFAVQKPRNTWTRDEAENAPRILVAILAKQAELFLPLYLECLDRQTYPKRRMCIYIRTNNNTDATERLLREWAAKVQDLYERIEIDSSDVPEAVENYGNHEWNSQRFRVLGLIRNASLQKTLELNCDYYFVSDVDNFIIPSTLQELASLRLPIVAPLMRFHLPRLLTTNFWSEVNEYGYYKKTPTYDTILSRAIMGIFEVPLVHCTYLVRSDVIKHLTYTNPSKEIHEFMIFSESARNAGIPQYVDNRQVYGYILEIDPKISEDNSVISKFFDLLKNSW